MLVKIWKYRRLAFLHYVQIPACRALHAMGLVTSDQVDGLVAQWEQINREATLLIIQDKWK